MEGLQYGILMFFCFNAIYIGIFLEYVYIYILDVFVFVYIGIIDRIHRDIYIYIYGG